MMSTPRRNGSSTSSARNLFVDLPGHGISDRPEDFGYTLEEHTDALAAALDTAGVRGAELIAHGMGGSVAIVLGHRRPDLVSRLVLTEANLDWANSAMSSPERTPWRRRAYAW